MRCKPGKRGSAAWVDRDANRGLSVSFFHFDFSFSFVFFIIFFETPRLRSQKKKNSCCLRPSGSAAHRSFEGDTAGALGWDDASRKNALVASPGLTLPKACAQNFAHKRVFVFRDRCF